MSDFLTKEQEEHIVEAIREAENATSGEIRVHIEKSCETDDPVERAKEVFAELDMHKTDLRNGVIIYVATDDHKVAIWGDEGIHKQVGQDFWEEELNLILKYFRAGDFESGIRDAVLQAGEKLKEFFPVADDDVNELPDQISYNTDQED